ncbi:hypothetical protein RSAG8_05009, partial [Rhizoctonia solani AG-8 WAC10335]
MAPRPTRRNSQPAPPQHGGQQMCYCNKWRYPHQLAATCSVQPRQSAEWEQDPSSPDFLPYAPSSSRPSYTSRSRSHASNYAPRIETLHYNPNYYQGQTYSEVEFDPEIDGQDPAPDSPHSDRSRTILIALSSTLPTLMTVRRNMSSSLPSHVSASPHAFATTSRGDSGTLRVTPRMLAGSCTRPHLGSS